MADPKNAVTPAALRSASTAVLQFQRAYFPALVALTPEADVFTSPLNVLLAMALAQGGSTVGSPTDTELQAALHLNTIGTETEARAALRALWTSLVTADPAVTIAIANAVFAADVRPEYTTAMQEELSAEVHALQSADQVNNWAASKTNNLIKKIIDELDPSTLALLASAIYFKGAWSTVFDADLTADDAFTRLDGTAAPIRMMNRTLDKKDKGRPRFGAVGSVARAVDLPYGSGRIRTLIVLPNEPGLDGLDATQAELLRFSYAACVGRLESAAGLQLSVPRFEIEFSAELTPPMQAIGINSAFSGGFDRMSERSAFIGRILHKAVLKCNEEGAEAAAVTVVEMRESCIRVDDSEPKVLRVDRPFFFVIADSTTDTVLFIGRIVNPTGEAVGPAVAGAGAAGAQKGGGGGVMGMIKKIFHM